MTKEVYVCACVWVYVSRGEGRGCPADHAPPGPPWTPCTLSAPWGGAAGGEKGTRKVKALSKQLIRPTHTHPLRSTPPSAPHYFPPFPPLLPLSPGSKITLGQLRTSHVSLTLRGVGLRVFFSVFSRGLGPPASPPPSADCH